MLLDVPAGKDKRRRVSDLEQSALIGFLVGVSSCAAGSPVRMLR